MLQPPEPILVTDLFPEVLERLITLLSGFDRAAWERPTVCTGWSVKDVALHLLGVEIGNLSRRRDGHTVSSVISGWDELVDFIDGWNQDWVRVSRRISSPLLVEMLRLTGVQVCEYFRLLDPFLLGGPVAWVGTDPAPVWLDIAREYTERWHHQQHIRDAVHKPGLKEPMYFAPVLATFAWALPKAFQAVHASEGTTVALSIRGQSGGRWSIQREGSEWRFYEGETDTPNAEVAIDEEIAWRLFTRGIGPEAASEHLTYSGDRKLGANVLKMVSIIA